MAGKFNMKEGVSKALKTALKSDSFISAVFDMLLGEKDAANEVEYGLKAAAQENTLNEIVSVHRLYKHALGENAIVNLVAKPGELVDQLKEIRNKSIRFQRRVLIRTLKKPGMFASFIYVIKAILTAGYPLDDLLATPQAIKLITTLIETAIEVANEDSELELAIKEAVMKERLCRAFKHGSHSRSVLSEEFEDRYGGRMPVNVYTGRFQPFHLGHLSNLEEAAKRGLRTVICPVMAGKTAKSIASHPFNGELEEEMFNRLKTAYGDLIADIIPIQKPSLDAWVEAIRERGMEPITWTTGMDRKPSYDAMIQRYGQDFNLVDNFEVIGLEKDMDAEGGSADDTGKISGTAVRKCLVDGDEEGFRMQMPQCLWDMYDAFRQALMPAQQTITESKAYEDFRKCLDKGLNELLK